MKSLKLKEKCGVHYTSVEYQNILYHTSFGERYILENIDTILMQDENFVSILLEYAVQKKSDFCLNFLVYNSNLHVRALTMIDIICKYPQLMPIYSADILSFFTNQIGEYYSQISLFLEKMSMDDLSNIAYHLFLNGYTELFNETKDFLFSFYDTNILVTLLLQKEPINSQVKEEICNDIHRYFLKDENMRYYIYKNFKDYLDEQERFNYEKKMAVLKSIDEFMIQHIYSYGLGNKMESYIEKYLNLSKDKSVEVKQGGSTCSVIRIGDYFLKLFKMKWSYEDMICPDVYLTIKNLEEDYIRDKEGVVLAGLEVQTYLKRDCRNVPPQYFDKFRLTMKSLGYFVNDHLLNDKWGDNVRLLDSYLDANTDNPEEVPDWFREYPIVLVDRDRVYPDKVDEIWGRRRMKQLRESWS